MTYDGYVTAPCSCSLLLDCSTSTLGLAVWRHWLILGLLLTQMNLTVFLLMWPTLALAS